MNENKKNGIIVLVGAGGVLIAVIFMMLANKTENNSLGLVGMAIFALTVVGLIIASSILDKIVKAKNGGKSSVEPMVTTLDPRLLMDERTKQDPDVQRLLQYHSVQKVFFDPNYLATAEAQNDPNVRELLQILDRMSKSGKMYNDLAPYPGTGGAADANSAYISEMKRREDLQRERQKNTPRRTVSKILRYVGLALFLVPFIVVFTAGANGRLAITAGTIPLLFGCALVGAILNSIANIIKRKK